MNDKIFRTKDGTRVYLTNGKSHYTRPNDAPNESVVRVKDGHALWGYSRQDLMTEEDWKNISNQKPKLYVKK
jgi:hypothetical protein